MTRLLSRLRVLYDGKIAWEADDGTVEHETLGWKDRWALFGVHSYNWWWVRHWGQSDCGCTVNPLTRRRVLICWDHAKAKING